MNQEAETALGLLRDVLAEALENKSFLLWWRRRGLDERVDNAFAVLRDAANPPSPEDTRSLLDRFDG